MKKLLPLFLVLIIFSVPSIAQFNAPNINWQKSLGGSGDDVANSVRQTSDGGYIVVGKSNSNNGDASGNHANYDFWVVRLNSSGVVQWQREMGGAGDDEAMAIQETSDHEFVIAGFTSSNSYDVSNLHGNYDFWVTKINATGQSGPNDWKFTYGGTLNEFAYDIKETFDGGYIVVGETGSSGGEVKGNHGNIDCWVAKLGYSGDLQYARTFGGTGNDYGISIQQTADSGYIVAGNSTSNNGDVSGNHGFNDAWVVKLGTLNDSLAVQWQHSLGGSGYDYARAIQQTTDGGYILAGYSNSTDGDVTNNHGGNDCWIVKLDASGSNIEWENSFGGSADDKAYSIQQTDDGGYVFGATTVSIDDDITGSHGNEDYWIVKLDPSGALKWQRTYGGTSSDFAYCLEQTPDDEGFIMAGSSNSTDGDVTGNHASTNDFWVVKLSAQVGIEEKNNPISSLEISPNPVSSVANIAFVLSESENLSIKIYDVMGREVKSFDNKDFSKGFHNITWNVNNLVDNGMYLLTMETKLGYTAKKMAVIK